MTKLAKQFLLKEIAKRALDAGYLPENRGLRCVPINMAAIARKSAREVNPDLRVSEDEVRRVCKLKNQGLTQGTLNDLVLVDTQVAADKFMHKKIR